MDLDSLLDDCLNDFGDAEKNAQSEQTEKTNIVETEAVPTKDSVPVLDDEEALREEPDLLDSILDDALNDFDQEEEREKLTKKHNVVKTNATQANESEDQLGGDLEKALEQMAAHLMEGGIDKNGEFEKNPNLDASIDQAVKMISEGAKNMSNDPQLEEMFSKMEGMEGMEDFFKEVMTSLDGMDGDGKGSVDDMVEKMFGQMLQKEHFEQPMRDIADKYPKWLEENAEKCTAEEFENYKKQFDCFQRILACYKAEPVDTNKIMELMKEMQEYGQPPEEIVSDMIPPMDGDPSKLTAQDMDKCPTM